MHIVCLSCYPLCWDDCNLWVALRGYVHNGKRRCLRAYQSAWRCMYLLLIPSCLSRIHVVYVQSWVCMQPQKEEWADCTGYEWLPEGMGKQLKQCMSKRAAEWAIVYMASGIPSVLQWQEACLGTCGALHPKAHNQVAPFCTTLFSNHSSVAMCSTQEVVVCLVSHRLHQLSLGMILHGYFPWKCRKNCLKRQGRGKTVDESKKQEV